MNKNIDKFIDRYRALNQRQANEYKKAGHQNRDLIAVYNLRREMSATITGLKNYLITQYHTEIESLEKQLQSASSLHEKISLSKKKFQFEKLKTEAGDKAETILNDALGYGACTPSCARR